MFYGELKRNVPPTVKSKIVNGLEMIECTQTLPLTGGGRAQKFPKDTKLNYRIVKL